MNDPVKCPDCKTWWRGQEHRCPTIAKDDLNYAVKDVIKKNIEARKKNRGCPLCGAIGVHGCPGPKVDTTYVCHRCGKKHDYRYSSYCDDTQNKWYK